MAASASAGTQDLPDPLVVGLYLTTPCRTYHQARCGRAARDGCRCDAVSWRTTRRAAGAFAYGELHLRVPAEAKNSLFKTTIPLGMTLLDPVPFRWTFPTLIWWPTHARLRLPVGRCHSAFPPPPPHDGHFGDFFIYGRAFLRDIPVNIEQTRWDVDITVLPKRQAFGR